MSYEVYGILICLQRMNLMEWKVWRRYSWGRVIFFCWERWWVNYFEIDENSWSCLLMMYEMASSKVFEGWGVGGMVSKGVYLGGFLRIIC
jgi:hypothetical protein